MSLATRTELAAGGGGGDGDSSNKEKDIMESESEEEDAEKEQFALKRLSLPMSCLSEVGSFVRLFVRSFVSVLGGVGARYADGEQAPGVVLRS